MSICAQYVNVLNRQRWRQLVQDCRHHQAIRLSRVGFRHLHVKLQHKLPSLLSREHQIRVEDLFSSIHCQTSQGREQPRHSFPITTYLADFVNRLQKDGVVFPASIWRQITARLLEEGYIAPDHFPESLAFTMQKTLEISSSPRHARPQKSGTEPRSQGSQSLTQFDVSLLNRLLVHHCQIGNPYAAWRCWLRLVHGRLVRPEPSEHSDLISYSRPNLRQLIPPALVVRLIRLLRDSLAYSDRFPERLLDSLDRLNDKISDSSLFSLPAIQIAILGYVASAPFSAGSTSRSEQALRELFERTKNPTDSLNDELHNAAFCGELRFELHNTSFLQDDSPSRLRLRGSTASYYNSQALKIIVSHIESIRIHDREQAPSTNAHSPGQNLPALLSSLLQPHANARLSGKKRKQREPKSKQAGRQGTLELLSLVYRQTSEGAYLTGGIDRSEVRRIVATQLISHAMQGHDREQIEIALARFIQILGPVTPRSWTVAELDLLLEAKCAFSGIKTAWKLFRQYCTPPSSRVFNTEGLKPAPGPRKRTHSVGRGFAAINRNSLPGQDAEYVRRNNRPSVREIWADSHRQPDHSGEIEIEGRFEAGVSTVRTLARIYVRAAQQLALRRSPEQIKIKAALRHGFTWTAGMLFDLGFSEQDISEEIEGIYSAEEIEGLIAARVYRVRRMDQRVPLTHRQDVLSVAQRVSGSAAALDAREVDLDADVDGEGLSIPAEGGEVRARPPEPRTQLVHTDMWNLPQRSADFESDIEDVDADEEREIALAGGAASGTQEADPDADIDSNGIATTT